jgi:hypothetical protein
MEQSCPKLVKIWAGDWLIPSIITGCFSGVSEETPLFFLNQAMGKGHLWLEVFFGFKWILMWIVTIIELDDGKMLTGNPYI